MKKGLIDPNGVLCQVEAAEFPVAPPFYWIDVADDIRAETHDFNGTDVVVKPTAPAPAPPTVVTRAQARKALVLAGLFAQVQPIIDAIADPVQRQMVQIDWDDRLTFERTNPTLLTLSNALGLTAEQLDGLFTTAATL